MAYDPLDFVEPNVCVDEHLTTGDDGLLRLQPWANPQRVADIRALSSNDGVLTAHEALPGKLLINQKIGWRNTFPVEAMVVLGVTRGPKSWIVSNPNAIQFRDRWTTIIDTDDLAPEEPVVTGIFNSQCGSAIDLGSNSVAEPNPGKQYMWEDVNYTEEWLGPVLPGQKINAWYRCYVWTPPPWSDNGNKNSPEHKAFANWVRLTMTARCEQGKLVTG